jgi:hypothetical protein
MGELYSKIDETIKTPQKSWVFVVFLSIGLYLADDNKTASNPISRLTSESSQATWHQQGRCLAVGNDTPSKNLAAKVVAP